MVLVYVSYKVSKDCAILILNPVSFEKQAHGILQDSVGVFYYSVKSKAKRKGY